MPSSGSEDRDRKMVRDDDDPKKWVYADHTRAKHRSLQYYMDQWARIVSNPNYPLFAFDFFAGRGEYYEPESDIEPIKLKEIEAEGVDYPGSPIIMIDTFSQQLKQHDNVDFEEGRLFFMEPKEKNREILRNNLNNLRGVPSKIDWTIIDGEFAEDAQEVVQESGVQPSGLHYSNRFALHFIDPYGMKPLDYDVVTDLAGEERADSIINLNTKNLVRWKDVSKHQEAIETLYGTDDWREELKNTNPDSQFRAETEYYKKRLEENGPEHVVSYLIHEEGQSGVMYNIVFTSNDKKGLKTAKEAIARVGTKHTLAHAPEDPEIHSQQQSKLTGGGMMTEDEATAQYILVRFGGNSMEFDELKTEMMVTQKNDAKVEKDYRRILDKMHKKGQVEIPKREPGGPLRDDFVIHIPETDD